MNTLWSLLWLLVYLCAGFAVARLRVLQWSSAISRIFTLLLWLLLFSMGLRLGQSREILDQLSLIGLLSVSSAVLASAGTVAAHLFAKPLYEKFDPQGESPSVDPGSVGDSFAFSRANRRNKLLRLLLNLRQPGWLLALVLCGVAAGLALPSIQILHDGSIASWLLYGLLFCIGIQMAGAGADLKKSFSNPSVLVLPIVTIAGTLAGSLALVPLFGLSPGRALALGGGFGWYSLSGVLIADLGDPLLGAAAFLSNLARETIAFVAIPLLRLTGRKESGIGVAGATSMDVTLPVIEEIWGPSSVPSAVIHGVVLSFLVPFLVPFFMSF